MSIQYISPETFKKMDKNNPFKKMFIEQQERDKEIKQKINKITKNIP
ncbi:10679_t:CDS:1, partial [Racocetra fulgida]